MSTSRAAAPRRHADVNAVVGGLLRDLVYVQTSPQRTFGYKRAASAVLSLERPLTELRQPDGSLRRFRHWSSVEPRDPRILDMGTRRPSSGRSS